MYKISLVIADTCIAFGTKGICVYFFYFELQL
jgi:hypothetical protein